MISRSVHQSLGRGKALNITGLRTGLLGQPMMDQIHGGMLEQRAQSVHHCLIQSRLAAALLPVPQLHGT